MPRPVFEIPSSESSCLLSCRKGSGVHQCSPPCGCGDTRAINSFFGERVGFRSAHRRSISAMGPHRLVGLQFLQDLFDHAEGRFAPAVGLVVEYLQGGDLISVGFQPCGKVVHQLRGPDGILLSQPTFSRLSRLITINDLLIRLRTFFNKGVQVAGKISAALTNQGIATGKCLVNLILRRVFVFLIALQT